MLWGATQRQVAVGEAKMTLTADNPMLYELGLHHLLIDSIQSLKAVFSDQALKKNWSIVWLKKERSSGSVGGAAGKATFLANYPVEQGKLSEDAQARLHRISVHESIHLMSPYQFPLWINESLAEYYAWKMTDKAGLKTESPKQQWASMQTRYPHAKAGLYEADHKVTLLRDMSYYPLFYVKGAAFWQQIDQALSEHGKSLDTFVKILNHSKTQLPADFVSAIQRIIGKPRWDTLESEYLI